MSDNSWEEYEPSPIEYFHYELMEQFHNWRKDKTKETTVLIDGREFNKIVVEAKKLTYEKYKALELNKPILKSEL